ncbi:hypothetical protein AB205_0056420 [Aquarana catesbeiana]|uniref:Uncharacterized protein n=1 Tax=Aquarana catesbeiana TaxID=8400 RepID=A0A2G9RC88_AQUCT|nr:hypothetical protein AB205_0056420 [Aquarana catesbeiana]
MAERQQVRDNLNNEEEESPEPETSGSRRRFKASNMAFVEMVEMVDILKRANYDGKGEKTRRTPLIRGHQGPPPQEEGEIPQTQPEEEVEDVVEIVTTTDDWDVVEEECHFTSESAQILIGEIMGCNRDLENKAKHQ